MRIKLNFENLEELAYLLKEITADIEIFTQNFNDAMDSIKDSASGQAVDKLKDNYQRTLKKLEQKKIEFEDAYDKLNKYSKGVNGINKSMYDERYYFLDRDELDEELTVLYTILDQKDDLKLTSSWATTTAIEEYEDNISQFYNVDSKLNIEAEYANDKITQEYILQKRDEIEENIRNYHRNLNTFEDLKSDVACLQNFFEDYENDLKKMEKVLTKLEEFENEFDPGFFTKYGEILKNGSSELKQTLFEAEPWDLIAGATLVAFALIEGQNITEPIIKVIGNDDKLKQASQKYRGTKTLFEDVKNGEKFNQEDIKNGDTIAKFLSKSGEKAFQIY